jgi:hypothetical protein
LPRFYPRRFPPSTFRRLGMPIPSPASHRAAQVSPGATIFAVLMGAFDATFTMVRVSAVIAGQFVLTGNAACTAPVKVAFLVVNPST